MKSKILVFAFLFSAFACSSTSPQGDGSVSQVMVGDNKLSALLLNKVKSGTVTIPLSSLVEDFEIVQLEMHEDAIFRPTTNITVTEKYIGIRPISDNYKLFDRSGKFLCTLGKRGRGPGEFSSSLSDDLIDDKNGIVYLLADYSSKIFVYNTSGQFLKELSVPQKLISPKLFLSDDFLTVVHVPHDIQEPRPGQRAISEADAILFQFNINSGELLEKIAPPFEHLKARSYGSFSSSTRNLPGVFDFLPTYQLSAQYDTLYHIDVKRKKFFPFFTVKYDNLPLFANTQSKPRFYPLNKNLMLTATLDRTKEKISGWMIPSEIILSDLISKTSSRVKIVNDYLGHKDLMLSHNIWQFSNGYYVDSIQPEDLMMYIEECLAEISHSASDKEKLKKILSSIQEGTNNVVFIGKLTEELTNLW